MGRSIALFLALLAGMLIASSELRLPAPAPADAPATAFSAGRAMADVRLVASTPHPIGSAANHAVRDRVRLEAEPDHIGVWPDQPNGAAALPESESESEPEPQPEYESGISASEDGAA